ncbi:hypothetical protein MATL_G00113400 [Megalops atlanticus]|uniref:ERBB receptor feedback inhibitor 1 n=1 Tax=Megalops atlanticus TaxID=7932 RepID=A0A9D3Q070_MEGAT|nr:hypothetical protein MATL_G00113400 [Megalops atlanticus]
MRPKGGWIMSTAGLSAQEFPASLKSALLHDSHCLSMASAKPYWDQHHDLNNLYFSLDSSAMEYNLRVQQQVPASVGFERHVSHPHSPHSPGAQRLPPKKSRPAQLNLSSCTEPSMPGSPEAGGPSPCPLPCPADLSSDEAVDNEVEFFTSADESRRLVPEACPKPLAFRYGAPSRRSFRGCGQINYAYFDSLSVQEQRTPEQCEQQQQQQQQRREPSVKDCPRQQDRPQRRLRRSHSGPAGSFNKPAALRLSCHHHGGHAQDKPEVPPRVPIPPRPLKAADHRRWSAEVPTGGYSDDDKPPKVPPREPLSSGSSRTPSPKSLPSYLNGVMPPTQSFAPNPKYVSKALQRQNSEGSTSARTPCILPIIENGKKVSTTHYFLLPQRPVYLDKFERFFREADCEAAGDCTSASSTDWDCQTKHKPHVHMV